MPFRVRRRPGRHPAGAAPAGVPAPTLAATAPFASSPGIQPDSRPGFAISVLALLAFLLYSRIIEALPVRGLSLGLGIALLLYAGVTGRIRHLKNVPTALLMFMTAWMALAGLFGIYAKGSAAILTDIWARSLLVYIVVVCMATDIRSVQRLMAAIAWCLPAFSVMSFWIPAYVDDRLMVGISSLANPNDFALFLIVAIPFGVWYAAQSRHLMIFRAIIAISVAHAFILLFRTGSRGGLLAAAGVILVALTVAGRRGRIVIGAAAIVTALAAVALMPNRLQQRYMTIVYDDAPQEASDDPGIQHALGSKQARMGLFLTSLRITAQHPLLGVGPGMFADYIWQEGRAEGRHVVWKPTHNAYTQMSAESGIPAALAFLGIVIFCFRHTNRIRKAALTPALREHGGMSTCLLASFAAYGISAFFNSIALSPVLPLIAGVTVGLEESFRKAAAAAPVPAPAAATAAVGTATP